MKRWVSLVTLLLFLGVMVAACGGGGGEAEPEGAEEPTEAMEEPTEAMEEPTEAMEEPTEAMEEATEETGDAMEEATEETDDAMEEATEETGDAAAPATGEFEGTIKIATQSPLSGPQASIGVGIQRGAELGIEQLVAPLEDLGFTVELVPFDDQALPDVGTANANNIVSDPDILCVNGHLNSGVALAALPTYEGADLAMVSPANTNPRITDDHANAFRIVGRDDVQGAVGEQFAREDIGIQSVYIIHDQTDYGQGVAQFFRDNAEENGITVAGFEGTQEQSVFDSILTPLQAQNPDLIYFGGIYSQAGPFFAQARDRGIEAAFMGPDGLDNSELANLAGEAVADMYYTSVAAPVSQFPDAAQFAQDYEDRYGEPAPPFSAQAYDVVGICSQAIANAAQEVGGKPTPADVIDALNNLEPYDGITATYEFNDNGDPVQATYFILQVNYTADDVAAGWNENEVANRLEVAPPEAE